MIHGLPIIEVGMGVRGFFLGYLGKTVLSYEYSSFRDSQKEAESEYEEWKLDVNTVLTELEQLLREFQHEGYPDIDDWIHSLGHYSNEIELVVRRAPESADKETTELLMNLSGRCVAHKQVISDLYFQIYGETEGKDDLILPHQFEKLEMNGESQADQVLRHMAVFIAEQTQEVIQEIEDSME